MKDINIAKTYAKAFSILEGYSCEKIVSDFISFTELINSCNDLETLLFSEVFSHRDKFSVINKLLDQNCSGIDFHPLFRHILHFLIEKKRIGLFPIIFKELIVKDDEEKGFMRGTIEGPYSSIDHNILEKIKNAVESRTGKSSRLEYSCRPEISAGYRIRVGDLELNATLDAQLDNLKKTIIQS